jgi:hypothetical protein
MKTRLAGLRDAALLQLLRRVVLLLQRQLLHVGGRER